ncbi:MAG TPA: DMT family transporter [Candidatus Avipropionibacterium avicola]|uniref:DMT family transporter n=1 Tax=Candidatus Avipropionibacterium avicola TaxID=2840701 RepID=A0A9D1KPF4_9ACTN|nr:DMT family transporter [Candidatus Avipropionibacterium avicola]
MSEPRRPSELHLRDWLPWLIGLGALWGSSFVLIKVAVVDLHPLWVATGRVGFGGLALALIMVVRRLRLPRSPRAWLHGGFLGVVNCAIPFSLFAFAGERVPSLLSGLWNSTTPLIVLPLAIFAFRTETFTVRRLLGLVLGLAGALVLLGVWDLSGQGYDLVGQLMCLGAASCYGIGTAWSRRFISPRPEPPIVAAAIQMITGLVVMVPVALLFAGPPGTPGPSSLAAAVALGALGTGVGFAINLRNIALLGASAASTVTYLVPVFATTIGVTVMAEHLSWHHVLGGLVVLCGVGVAQGIGRGVRVNRVRRPLRDDRRPNPNPIDRPGSRSTPR